MHFLISYMQIYCIFECYRGALKSYSEYSIMAILVPFLIPFSFFYCKEKYNAFSEISILDAFPMGLEQSGNFHRKIRVGEPINTE